MFKKFWIKVDFLKENNKEFQSKSIAKQKKKYEDIEVSEIVIGRYL